ncbi:MAG TPA: adenine deaminase C-terminal domain-containing protein, partial [Acidiphilium sp.]
RPGQIHGQELGDDLAFDDADHRAGRAVGRGSQILRADRRAAHAVQPDRRRRLAVFEQGRLNREAARDVLKVAVIERHGINGNIGRGFVKGFGIAGGALAASVGHDSHNICVVGTNDADMALAVNHLIALGGGFTAVRNGAVLGSLALPMAGLISLEPFAAVRAQLISLRDIVHGMGSRLPEPFLQLAFLALPVIPHLKITDRGLVDVDRFELIDG